MTQFAVALQVVDARSQALTAAFTTAGAVSNVRAQIRSNTAEIGRVEHLGCSFLPQVAMVTTAEQMRSYEGPAILSYGFRPFFLLGAIWAALAVAVWLPMLAGSLSLPTAFAPVEWHVHELLYGYLPAIVAGFLLTAVPNWTGRLPVTGGPLLGLLLVWVAGRLAVAGSVWVGRPWAAAVDLLFLAALAAVVLREILAARNLRNLKVLLLIGVLLAGNAIFHAESALGGGTGFGNRIGIAAAVLLISVIGGRIIPSFTRNWLARKRQGSLPQPFNRFDIIALIAGATALALWIAVPEHGVTAAAALAAGLLHGLRLARWHGYRTAAEPLVLVLHVAYLFVPVGFFLVAAGITFPAYLTASGALHGWTAGAVGLMTLAVMTRASLGHTGRPLTATAPTLLIYVAALLAALARIVSAFGLERDLLLDISATAWVMAFAGFAIVYWPLLTHPRPEIGRDAARGRGATGTQA
jgi:uncharacterized protein involved in response to NO